MEKIKACSVIKFLHMKGCKAWKIHDEMKSDCCDDCPSFTDELDDLHS